MVLNKKIKKQIKTMKSKYSENVKHVHLLRNPTVQPNPVQSKLFT